MVFMRVVIVQVNQHLEVVLKNLFAKLNQTKYELN